MPAASSGQHRQRHERPARIAGAGPDRQSALRAHRNVFEAAEQKFRIDRRAIAGAVAWEIIENPHPQQLPTAAGWGKIHKFNFKKNQPATWLRSFGAAYVGADPQTIATETE